MRALYNNLFDSPETIDSLSEATNYPIENAQNVSLDKVWRSTGLASETVTIDAGAGETFTMDSFAIVGHNLTSGATIDFQMNATDAWGAPSVDESVTWRAGIIVHYFTSATYRFARIVISDAANTDGYIEVSRFFEGAYLQFDPSSTIEFKIDNIRNDIQIFSDANVAWTREGVSWRTFEYKFPRTAYTMVAKLRTMWDTVGLHKPIIFMNYDDRFTEIDPAYCLIMNNFSESWKAGQKVEYDLRLREVR